MIYTKIEKEDNWYKIYYSDAFYDLFESHYYGDSYWNVLYRLFGLLPQDFYHMVGAQYHVHFQPSTCLKTHIYMLFSKYEDVERFCNEIDKRLTYCVNRGDFT